eukprot:COSAG02_NODE_1927_length_10340_cov_2.510497_3_plen_168_part_00
MLANPHWALKLANGSVCYMDGDFGPAYPRPLPAHGQFGAMKIFDFGQQAVQDTFVAACVDPVRAGLADGCFLDRAISCLPTQDCALGESGCLMCPLLSSEAKTAYSAGHAAVLRQIQEGIGHEKPLIANHATNLASTNAAQLENFFQGQSKFKVQLCNRSLSACAQR